MITASITQKVAIVSFCSDFFNRLCVESLAKLNKELSRLDSDSSVNCLILHGNENHFSAGFNLPLVKRENLAELFDQIDLFGRRRKPLITVLNGYVLGGGLELALASDMLIATRDTKFAMPEIAHEIIPGAKGMSSLERLVGKQLSMELVLTGRQFTAADAMGMRIVNYLTETKKEAIAKALSLGRRISRHNSDSVRCARECIALSSVAPDDVINLERRNLERLLSQKSPE